MYTLPKCETFEWLKKQEGEIGSPYRKAPTNLNGKIPFYDKDAGIMTGNFVTVEVNEFDGPLLETRDNIEPMTQRQADMFFERDGGIVTYMPHVTDILHDSDMSKGLESVRYVEQAVKKEDGTYGVEKGLFAEDGTRLLKMSQSERGFLPNVSGCYDLENYEEIYQRIAHEVALDPDLYDHIPSDMFQADPKLNARIQEEMAKSPVSEIPASELLGTETQQTKDPQKKETGRSL